MYVCTYVYVYMYTYTHIHTCRYVVEAVQKSVVLEINHVALHKFISNDSLLGMCMYACMCVRTAQIHENIHVYGTKVSVCSAA